MKNYIRIPNKNVYIYNNVFYNPSGYSSQWMHFAIYEPYANPPESNVPNPAVTDDNLQIRGNVIWNGDASMPLASKTHWLVRTPTQPVMHPN